MTLEVRLRVGLKGTDPVVSTAYLTLVDKMGYRGRLLAINRLDSHAFSVKCGDAATALQRLRRFLATQSTFYNRNKHNYFLECVWGNDRHVEGVPLEQLESMSAQAARWAALEVGQDLDGKRGSDRVILQSAPVFRPEILVEDTDPAGKLSLANKLETELADGPVTVSESGIRWYLALKVPSDTEASELAEEIAVTRRKDLGLLLNPNYQRYKLLSLKEIELNKS